MGKKKKRLAAVAVAGAVMLALAATGLSSAGADARGVTSSSITVAGLGYSAYYQTAAVGAQARFKAINDAGGIAGRKINFTGWNDDGSNPNTNLTQAKQLVQQAGVFAIVPVITPYMVSGSYLAAQKVPFVGWAISQQFCSNNYGFGFTGCIVPPPPVNVAGATWGELVNQELASQGGAKGKAAAVIAEDNDSGKAGAVVIGASAKAAGMKVTYQQASIPALPAVVGDYSPYVNAIMTSNGGKPPDAVFLTLAFQNVQGMAKGLEQAGYKGIITNAVAYDPSLTASAKGQSAFTQFATPEAAATNPNMAAIVKQIQAVNGTKPIGQAILAGYFSADFFVKVLQKVGKNLTPARFAAAAATLRYGISGVVGTTKYPAGRKLGTPCGQLIQSDGTQWNIVAPYHCYWNVPLSNPSRHLPY